jgi:hypothetical protein
MMRALIFSFSLLTALLPGLKAQDKGADAATRFYAQALSETVALGNYVQIAFVLENGNGGKFTPPDWEAANCTVVGGPSQSSVISYVNGRRRSELKYVYYIAPNEAGKIVIPPAKLDTGSQVLETAPVEIKVVPGSGGANPPQGNRQPAKEQKPLKTLRPTIRI